MSPTTCRSISLAPSPEIREMEKVGFGGRLCSTRSVFASASSL
jgi:hypothetical protein